MARERCVVPASAGLYPPTFEIGFPANKYQECPQRPLIFIGHCFGGLVIQKVWVLLWTVQLPANIDFRRL